MMLKDKICLITGATRGIGWATAELFAEHGATLALNARSTEQLEERASSIRTRFGTPVLALAGDAGDPSSVQACYQQIFKQYKKLDVLVNNAGIMQDALLGMISDGLIQSLLRTNVAGAILHMQAATRMMTRAGAGSIINISSVVGRFGNEGQTVYAGTKAAVIGITQSAAKELAPKGIRVNAVAPGMIDTDMTRSLPAEKHQQLLKSVKMGRIGQPREIAQAILFLASDMSSYVTGQVIGVDGGILI